MLSVYIICIHHHHHLFFRTLGLRTHGKCLQDFPHMPLPEGNWSNQEENQLINDQCQYNIQELQQFVQRGLPTLNPQQIPFFLHSGGGCGKTYLANLITASVCARGEIVLCVVLTGLASLLLPGGSTAHSHFKIPIPIHKQSTCNVKKDDLTYQLLQHTSLIIWDEAGSQHHYVLEAVCYECYYFSFGFSF